ncbi:ciliogenesis-associated TTC17-interacting protein [Narcine bancroftii]|uniref:ciliogenesis-associated TTC17-interacting protein n=1 Tax=Narcine bancroftii TaxID=1343680 RepID=UPI003831FA30
MSTSENQEPPFNLEEGLSLREGGSVSEVPSLKDLMASEEAKSSRTAISLEISPTKATIPGQPPLRKMTSPGKTTPPVDAMIQKEGRSSSQPTSPREMTSPGETTPPVDAMIPKEGRSSSQPTSPREMTSPGETTPPVDAMIPKEGRSSSQPASPREMTSPGETTPPVDAMIPKEGRSSSQPASLREMTSLGETTPPVDAMIPKEGRSPSQPASLREMTSPGETTPPVEALIPREERSPSLPTTRRDITSPGEEIITRERTSTEEIKSSEPNLSTEQLESLDQQRTQAFPYQPIQVSPTPLTLKAASPEAINFLASITLKDLALTHFTDRLVTVSETGKELGEFIISFQPIICEGLPGVNVTASSQGSIDNIPCGTSISAHISSKLETVALHHHEYIKLKNHSLVKETVMKKEQGFYVMTRDITMGQNVKSETLSFNLTDLRGFVSEASNLVLLRIMAQQNYVPDNMVFLSFDTEMQLCISTYLNLGPRMLTIGKRECEVLSIQRTIHSEANGPMCWQCSFLPDGHLTSRVQVGSPITMQLKQLPHIKETDVEDPKPIFEKKPLNWEEDIQLYFKFLDKTEALKADYSSYVRHHPELKCILADFLQSLLLRKPQDVLTFATEYFSSFSTFQADQAPILTSSKANPYKQP